MSELVAQSRVLQISPVSTVVEISFRGTHEWAHGSMMHRYVEEAISKNRPSGIVFNLLDYEYVFGNDVTALFTAAYNRDTKKPRPVYIAATGTTYKSLRNLFNSG